MLITGAPGIGKSAVARELMSRLPGSAWLDGDDVWRAHPFRVDQTTKAMVVDNIAYVLAGFLKAGYRHAILSWVLHRQETIEDILRLVNARCGVEYSLHVFTLTADEATFRDRWAAGGRGPVAELALDRLEQSRALATRQVDTVGRSPAEIADELAGAVLGASQSITHY